MPLHKLLAYDYASVCAGGATDDVCPPTITEQIVASHAREGVVWVDAVEIVGPDIFMLNDVSSPLAFDQFDTMGANTPFDPDRVVLVAGYLASAKVTTTTDALGSSRVFASTHGISRIYEFEHSGIEHVPLAQVGPEVLAILDAGSVLAKVRKDLALQEKETVHG